MTKDDLIFDWRKPEASFRDKAAAFVLVLVVFVTLLGIARVRIPAVAETPAESASVLRFKDDDLGRFWAMQAEEDGPFPGRLELDGFAERLDMGLGEGAVSWSDYKSAFRQLDGEQAGAREILAAKGARVFPSRQVAGAKPESVSPVPRELGRVPVLIPYDLAAAGWMPGEFPPFPEIQGAAETSPASWRFMVNLREDGTVREAIPLNGGDDAWQSAMQAWMLGLRFKPGSGDRWLGLRAEFLNQPDDGTDPE